MKKSYLFILTISISLCSDAQPWQTLANLPVDLAFPVVVELNGNIHVMGGGASSVASDLHLRYTPSTDTWDTLAPVPYRAQQPAGAVVNGKIHFCGGGFPNTGTPLDLHYYYDPDSAQWYQAANMPVPTAIHKAVSLDGKMYVLSGQPNRYLCEYYDPVSDSWTQLNSLPDQNFWYGAIAATGQTIYRFGGGGYLSPVNLAHRYDKLNDTWVPLPVLPEALHAPAGVTINDSLIVYSGGYLSAVTKDKVWIYNTNAQTYTLSDSLPAARNYHSMVKVDTCIYSVGGYNISFPSMGFSLIKNCASNVVITSVPSPVTEVQKPYSISITPSVVSIYLDSHYNGDASVRLIDVTGRTVLSQGTGNGSIEIRNETLSTGLYLVIIYTGEQSYVERWAVNH